MPELGAMAYAIKMNDGQRKLVQFAMKRLLQRALLFAMVNKKVAIACNGNDRETKLR